MRINVYAEEMTNHVEIIEKETDGGVYTGLRIYLYLPVTLPGTDLAAKNSLMVATGRGPVQVRGPFKHHPDDDDSSAVTFWGKADLRVVLKNALKLLDQHYAQRGTHKTKPKTKKEVQQGSRNPGQAGRRKRDRA